MKYFLIAAVLMFSVSGFSENFKGYTEVHFGRKLYVDYLHTNPGAPTLVLLNGLTYDTTSWDQLMPYIKDKGFNILRYNAYGQDPNSGMLTSRVLMNAQAMDLAAVLDNLKIDGPVMLAGLSYGGGLEFYFSTLYPSRVKGLIPMAPLMNADRKLEAIIKSEIQMTRAMNPYNRSSDNDLYEFFFHQLVYATFPAAEPSVLSNPYKLENVFRMALGTKNFHTLELLPRVPQVPIHLMVAEKDQYIPTADHDALWNGLSQKQKASRINIIGSEHKIPEAVPRLAGEWITGIMLGRKEISGGKVFEGDPKANTARCGKLLINL